MKIGSFSAIIFLCLTLALFMTSCQSSDIEAADTGADSTEAAPETEYTPLPPATDTRPAETEVPETEFDDSLREPIENKKALRFIEFQYKKALEAIDIAKNGALEEDDFEISTENGFDGSFTYYKVVKDTTARPELDGGSITDFETLSKYIRSIFARSIADDLLGEAQRQYIEIDDHFCKLPKNTDELPTEENTEDTSEKTVRYTEFFLSKFSDKLFRYTARVTYSDTEDVDYFDFIFENTGSGWYWTVFPELPA